MLRISLMAMSIYFVTVVGVAQTSRDTTAYKSRRLTLEEANFVSSYYTQEGNNAAVTGGLGSEHLTDFATLIDVKFTGIDSRKRQHVLFGEAGVDVYSSASSDKIDPTTLSSASSQDVRFYPSLTYTITKPEKRESLSVGASFSAEYDYLSRGFSLGWAKTSKDKNREFSTRAQVFLDTWSVILPIELRGKIPRSGKEPRNTYSTSFIISQVINKRLQLQLLADVAYQKGQLATLFHRTYFTDGSLQVEKLPDTRLKLPLGLRAHYFWGDRLIVRTYYRYYRDSWGLHAHALELETPLKLTSFFSLSPFYRFYKQQGIRYFQAYGQHLPAQDFYTSDYDLSTLQSNTLGFGLRVAPPGGLFNLPRFNAVELRVARYRRSTDLNATILSLLVKYK